MHSRKPKPYISRSPSMKLILRKNAKQPSFIASKKPKLENVSGITATNNSTFSYSTQDGLIAYPSGSVTVLYDFYANKHDYLVTSYKKTITSCSFSPDGKYFVTGECGLQPAIRVWDLKDKTELAQFYSHKYEVACVSFSPDMKYLVSIGSHHDMSVNVWDWKNKSKMGCNKISAKVKALSINEGSTFFVTVGVKHVKFWSLLPALKSECYKNEPLPLTGRAAVLDSLLNETFDDVRCGFGINNNKVYTVSQNGVLSLLSAPPARRLEISVDLQATVGNCLAVSEKAVICGGAQGRVCLYSANDLALISVLPPPSPLGGLSKSIFLSLKPPTQGLTYADCMAACLDPHHKYAFCLYSDRSFYAWDLKDVFNIRLLQSQHFHSSCVWGILMAGINMTSVSGQDQPFLPLIITCSSDDTVRFWVHENEDDQLQVSLDATQNFNNTSPLFQVQQHEGLRLKHVLYLDNTHAGLCQIYNSPAQSTLASKEKAEVLNRQHLGIRAMALSKDGKLIALGDRIGNLRIYELEDFKVVAMIEAHDGEILSLDFSHPLPGDKQHQQHDGRPAYFLASGSRDRLIHVYDPRTGFTQCQTLQDHSSHVYSVRFSLALPTNQAAPADDETTLAGDHRRCKTEASLLLLSCAADQSLIIREAVPINGANANDYSGPGITFVVLHQISNIGFRLYDMDIDVFGRHVVTACQDRNIRVYDIVQGKQKYVCKGSLSEEGRLIKVVFDPSGTFVATSCRDKTVYIIDFGSGEVVASFSGHSEDVMDLKFSGDCRRLVTATTEGSIFTWKLSTDLIKRMLSRLPQVTTTPNGPYLTHITSSQLSKGPFVSQDHRELPTKVQVQSSTAMPPRSHDSQEMAVVTTFEKDSNVDFNHPAGYKFSIGQLPSWAQKQVTALGNSKLPSFLEQEPSTKSGFSNSSDVSRRLDVTIIQQSSLEATVDDFRATVDNESPPSDMIYTAASTSNQKSKSLRWGLKTFNGTTAPKTGEEIYGASNLSSSYSLIDISSSQLVNQPDARALKGDFDDSTNKNIYESLSSKVNLYGQRGMAKSMADIRVAAPTTGPQIVTEFVPTDYDASSSDDKDSMSSSSVSQQHQQQTNSSINTTLRPPIQKSPFKTLAVGEDEFSSDYNLNSPTISLTTDPNRKSISHKFFHRSTFQSPDPALHSNPLKQTVQEMDAARAKMKNVLESLRFDSPQDQSDTPFIPIANTSKYRSMSKSISSFLSPSLDESSRLDPVSSYEGTPMRPQRWQHSSNSANFTGGFTDLASRRKSEHMENCGPKVSSPENRFSLNRGLLQKYPTELERIRKDSATASSSPKASVTSSVSSLLSNACDNRPNNLKCSPNPYLPGSYASPTQNQGRKPLSYISCGGRRPTALGPNGHHYQNPAEGPRASPFGNRRSTTGFVTNLFSGLRINSPACVRDYPDSQDVGNGMGCGEWRSMTSLTIPRSSGIQGDRMYIGKQQKTTSDKNGFGAPAQFYGNPMYASQHSLLGLTRCGATTLSKSPSFRDLLKEATKIQGSREDLTAGFLGSNLPSSGSTMRPNLVKSLGIKNLVEYKYHTTNPFAYQSSPEGVNHKEPSPASPLSPKSPQPILNSRQNVQTTAPLSVKSVALNDENGEETGTALLNLDTRTSPDGIVSSLPESKVLYFQSGSKFFTTASGLQASTPMSDLVYYSKMDSFKAAYDQLKGSLRDLGKLVDCSQILRSVENSMSQMLDAYHKHEREGQQVCLHQYVQRLGADLLNSQARVVKHYDAVTKLLTQIYAMNLASLCPSDQHPRRGSQHNDNPYLEAVQSLKSSLVSHLQNLETMTKDP